ncbi:MAG: hypothetical protein ACRDTU_03630 [Micromonosporaceae bacterium]
MAVLAVALLLSVTPLGDMLWPAPGDSSERDAGGGSSARKSEALEPGAIPDSAFLLVEDLDEIALGYDVADDEHFKKRRLSYLFKLCGEQHTVTPVHDGKPRQWETDSSPTAVVQFAERFAEGGGVKYLKEVIALSDRCNGVGVEGGGTTHLRFSDEDFADNADASFIIRERNGLSDDYHVFVRQGDVVTEVVLATSGFEEKENAPAPSIVREVGLRAALRLCAAASC